MTKQDPKDEKPKAAGQKPTIGRIVHFVLPGYAHPAPAIVVSVDPEDERKVDLTVALPHGHPNGFFMTRPGVSLDDSETPAEHTWHWPARI